MSKYCCQNQSLKVARTVDGGEMCSLLSTHTISTFILDTMESSPQKLAFNFTGFTDNNPICPSANKVTSMRDNIIQSVLF